MNVLFITHHFVDGTSGGSFASRAFVNAFAHLSNRVRLLYPDSGKNIAGYLEENVEVKGVSYNIPKWMKLLDLYRGKINRYSHILFKEIEDFQPDLVVFDTSLASAGFTKRVGAMGIKIITIHHNYQLEYFYDDMPPLLYRKIFLYYVEKAEREAIENSNLNITLTNQDVALLRKHYDKAMRANLSCLGIFESGNNVSIDQIKTKEDKTDSTLVFAISGSLGKAQTENSLIPFLRDYFPSILKLFPLSSLIISGKNPSLKLINTCKGFLNIKLIPNPVNMDDVLSKADIYLCPIFLGGGLKLRVLDGLKLGLPVLAHEISARGYDQFLDAGYLYTYKNKSTFEESLKKIFSKKGKNKEIMDMYRKIFSFEAGTRRLKEVLQENNLD